MVRSPRSDARRIDNFVSENIRTLRVARKLSQTDLAQKLGVSFQMIQKYEKGTCPPAAGRLRELCSALKVSPNDLFDLLPKTITWPGYNPSARFSRQSAHTSGGPGSEAI